MTPKDIQTTDKNTFLFPLLCIPIRLKATTIFWILTLTDMTIGSFASLIGFCLYLSFKTWYSLLIFITFSLAFGTLAYLFVEITFVNCRKKTRQDLIRKCKQYTIARYVFWCISLVFKLFVLIYINWCYSQTDTSMMQQKYRDRRSHSINKYIVIIVVNCVIDIYEIVMSFMVKLSSLVRIKDIEKKVDEFIKNKKNEMLDKPRGRS